MLSRSEAVSRAVAVACLNAIAVVHLMDLPHKVQEAQYMAAMFCGLIVGCVVTGAVLVSAGERLGRRAWVAAATLCGATIVGYCVSRAVALPGMEDHQGDWLNPLGISSLMLESTVIAVAARDLMVPPVHIRRPTSAAVPPSLLTALVVALIWSSPALGHHTASPPPSHATPGHAGAPPPSWAHHHRQMGDTHQDGPQLPPWALSIAIAAATLWTYHAAERLLARTRLPDRTSSASSGAYV